MILSISISISLVFSQLLNEDLISFAISFRTSKLHRFLPEDSKKVKPRYDHVEFTTNVRFHRYSRFTDSY